MKAEEISVGHVYLVNFEPHERGEFDGKHLAVVVKKNHDDITFVVIPMTSSNEGVGVNKISLGKLDCLPSNLKGKESFAVIDQLRTLNAKRFSNLFQDNTVYQAVMPRDKMIEIYRSIIKDLLHDVPANEILKIFL